jgi:small subunit ribosomal protein S6
MSTHRQYELVYIVSPESGEQEVADLHTQVEAVVSRFGGQVEKTENWGRRKLAYEIGRHKEGTYVLEVINGPGEMVRELDRRLRVADRVIRHLTVRVDEELIVAERARAERAAHVQARRVARGLPAEPEPSEAGGAPAGEQPAEQAQQAEVNHE